MDFTLSGNQQEMVDAIAALGASGWRREALSGVTQPERVPTAKLKHLGEMGVLGISLSREHGGGGGTSLDGILALEALARVDPHTGAYAMFAIAGPPSFIDQWGSDEQRARYLPGVISGDRRFSIGVTETDAGSAMTDLTTRAEIVGGHAVINGSKIFSGVANSSDHFLVFVRFGEGTKGIGAVIVDRDTPGFIVSEPRRFMNNMPWSELRFEDCRVPIDQVLLRQDAMKKLMSSYSLERLGAAAHALGTAQLALDLSIQHAESREQFGHRLTDFQLIQGKLADMYIQLESARLLLYSAVVEELATAEGRVRASAARVAAVDAACFVTDEAIQIHGAHGFSQESGVEWLYRMVRGHAIAGGTQEIHRSMIASSLVGRSLSQR